MYHQNKNTHAFVTKNSALHDWIITQNTQQNCQQAINTVNNQQIHQNNLASDKTYKH